MGRRQPRPRARPRRARPRHPARLLRPLPIGREGSGGEDGAGGGGDVRAGPEGARPGGLPPLPPLLRPQKRRDGGSGRGQRLGGAGEVRGGVRRPQPGAWIRLPQLVQEDITAPKFAHYRAKSHTMFLQCIHCVPAPVNCEICKPFSNRQYVVSYFSYFVTSLFVYFTSTMIRKSFCLKNVFFSESNTYVRIQSISHRAYALIQRNWLQVKHSLHGLPDDETPKSSGVTSSDLCSQACSSLSTSTNAGRKTPGRAGDKEFDAIGQLKEFPCVSLSSTEGPKPIDDVAKLRKELQNTLMTYGEAHEDVVHAKKKIQVLSNDCSEDLKEVQDALRREELLKQTAAYEKSKHFRAITDTEMVKEAFTCEAYSKHKTESVANMMSTETGKVVDALLCTGKTCRRYLRHEIELATDNFSDAKKIGEGGYGIVYRCTLDHTEVAVKVIQQDSSDKIDEFFKEVEILSQLHHPNLVLLLGFCPEIGCLVYEYMENGSLEDQLINNKGCQPLHWFMRFQIIFEVARGLAFLHGTKPEPIVHRDLKPGNILLDKNYVSKIGDVGFAKLIADLVPDGFTEYRDTVIAGTLYYMDPEYQLTGTVRPKSDLFALGIIVLQLLTGKHPHGLILSAEEAIRKDTFSDILDQSQTDWPIAEAETLAKLGLRCTALKCRDRPNLESEVLPVLEDLLSRVTSSLKSRSPNVVVPSHFVCPILQEVMDDPYVAADGHTYEYRAIKAWLKKHKISPVTKHKLPNSSIIPSHSLHAAIQRWKSQSS